MRRCSSVGSRCWYGSIQYGLLPFVFIKFVAAVFILDLADAFNGVIIPCIHDIDVIIFTLQIYLHINYHLLQPRHIDSVSSCCYRLYFGWLWLVGDHCGFGSSLWAVIHVLHFVPQLCCFLGFILRFSFPPYHVGSSSSIFQCCSWYADGIPHCPGTNCCLG